MTGDHLSHPSQLDDEACVWVERFATGKGRRDDVSALKEWMARSPAHAEAFDRISRTWSSLDVVGTTLATAGLISRGRTQARPATARVSVGRRAFLGGALAASAAGVAVAMVRPPLDLWPSLRELTADIRTRPGERRKLAFDQHVSIDMNTRTSVTMGPTGSEARLVTGEVTVSAMRTETGFVLAAMDGRVIAGDARFNVRITDDDAVCATCIAGSLRVEQHAKAISLTAGEQVTYSDSGMAEPAKIDPGTVTAWNDGIVVFDAAPVSQVITEINRYRPGKIILTNDELGRRLFSARLRVENIGNVVRQIELAFNARARALPGGITLLG